MKHIPYLEPTPAKEMKILMCKHIMAKRPKFLAEKDTIEHILAVGLQSYNLVYIHSINSI